MSAWALGAFVLTRGIGAFTQSTFTGSDEASYFESGSKLAHGLPREIFWPPLVPWLDALVVSTTRAESFMAARVLWHLFDLAVFLLLPGLARGLEGPVETDRRWTLGEAMQMAYAVYLPAIGFSSVATSEMPTLLLVCLLSLTLLGRPEPTTHQSVVAGLLSGLLVLTRASLLPWLFALPLFLLSQSEPKSRGRGRRNALVAAGGGALVVLAVVLTNGLSRGAYVVSTNSYYDFYLGNAAVYEEDLDLFRPRATPEQIAYRRAYFSGDAPADGAVADRAHFAEACRFVARDPLLFGRRALGRLARVFAPKTEEESLLGDSPSFGLSAKALALIAVTNVEWGGVLFVGVLGLGYLARAQRRYFRLVWLSLAGSLPLCVVAISKPRYSFPFEVFLMMAALFFVRDLPRSWGQVWPRHKVGVCLAWLVLAWAWVAWLIFAFTSRS